MTSYHHSRSRFFAVVAALVLMFAASGAVLAKGNLIVGTTDTVTTVDPAKCYNYWCSSVVFNNAGNTLLGYAPGSTQITPELAKEMPTISEDGTTYTFKLRQDVTFHDGSPMTAKDVKFSLNRARWIDHPEGASFLLDGIKSIETPSKYTVAIHLSEPDITFSSKLAYAVATILPSDAYPSPDGPLPADASTKMREKYIKEKFIGTGPYKIVDFRENQSMLMKAYDDYWGKQPTNDKVLTRFFAKASQLLVALKSDGIDVAFRHLTPAQQKSLQGSDKINVIEGKGAAIRYIVFNPKFETIAKDKVRKAIAATIDRSRIVSRVLNGGGAPLFSMVPSSYEANVPTFKKRYEGKKASDYLDHPVDVTLWYSRGHYGSTEPAIAQSIARMLEETDMFNVTLNSSEWAQFAANAWPGKSGQYPMFLLGWYPDYLDPADYLTPFYYSDHSFLKMYDNPKMDKLLEKQKLANAPASETRLETLAQIQKLAAKDVPTLPLFSVTPFAYARKNIEGVAKTMGPAQLFNFSVIHRTGE